MVKNGLQRYRTDDQAYSWTAEIWSWFYRNEDRAVSGVSMYGCDTLAASIHTPYSHLKERRYSPEHSSASTIIVTAYDRRHYFIRQGSPRANKQRWLHLSSHIARSTSFGLNALRWSGSIQACKLYGCSSFPSNFLFVISHSESRVSKMFAG